MASLDPLGMGEHLRRARLDRLITCALRGSPLYQRRSGHARTLADFEPITKRELMTDFDAWATDRRVTLAGAQAVLAAEGAWTDAWLDRYMAWTSSGTSGLPGIFVQDAGSLAAFDAIDATRLRGSQALQPGLALWGMGRRFAYVAAVHGPYAGHLSLQRLVRLAPAPWTPEVHAISVLEPLPAIAERLRRLQPDVLITYPSCAAQLASLQTQGGAALQFAEVWVGGEQLSATQRELVQKAFDCEVRNSYGASEFYSIAFECASGRLHLNSDWVILEGIDERGAPVPDGEFSHKTLLTNLANRVQPLLRYELTDRVRFPPGPCACGCSFPVIEVQGRADDVLTLPGERGTVTVLPLALETVIEENAGVTHFQLCRLAPDELELRLPGSSDRRVHSARCRRALQAFFSTQGAKGLRIVDRGREPLRQRGSGKLRRVVDLEAPALAACRTESLEGVDES